MNKNVRESAVQNSDNTQKCGIIMPISAMLPIYDSDHWDDVRRIIDAAIRKAGMEPQIVSDAFETDIIQKRIINNLYSNNVVVCDVSGLNPNVMFELGVRITFKKPVIIVTDDFNTIPFDTKIIEHLWYPRDLHIHKTNDFIIKLSEKIESLNNSVKDGTFKSFIEDFGTYDVLDPKVSVVEKDQFILDKLSDIERFVRNLDMRGRSASSSGPIDHGDELARVMVTFKSGVDNVTINSVANMLNNVFSGLNVRLNAEGGLARHITITGFDKANWKFEHIANRILENIPPHCVAKITGLGRDFKSTLSIDS